jgi:hypothetical protein
MWPLEDPVVPVDLFEIVDRGRKLPPGAPEFNDFLKGYIVHSAVGGSARVAAGLRARRLTLG